MSDTIKRCFTKRGKRAHYTRDGVLTLCGFLVAERDLGQEHQLREAAWCFRCEKYQEASK